MPFLEFKHNGDLLNLEDLAEEYPYKQTQALVLAIDEAEVWLALAQKMIGTGHQATQLAEIEQWLQDCAEALEAFSDELDDEDVARCRLSADHELYELLDELIDNRPNDLVELDVDDEALDGAVNRMSEFWVTQVFHRVRDVLTVASGDGEPLAIISRHQRRLAGR